jgi:hypothetical protein
VTSISIASFSAAETDAVDDGEEERELFSRFDVVVAFAFF